jgi:hypothetical protein
MLVKRNIYWDSMDISIGINRISLINKEAIKHHSLSVEPKIDNFMDFEIY